MRDATFLVYSVECKAVARVGAINVAVMLHHLQ